MSEWRKTAVPPLPRQILFYGKKDDTVEITRQIQVINVGLEFFRDELERQDIPVVHLDWHPPAQGNSAVLQLLKQLRSTKKEERN